jgi:hypothetical protein
MTDAQKTSQARKNASAVCVAENGPGWSFNQATCNCIFTVGTVVGMKFRGCPTFMHLDTDTNYPTDYFQDPIIYTVFNAENKVVDSDPCSNKNGDEYQLRRLGTYSMEPQSFIIYPSPGDPGDVIYIQGKSRRTACLDRSFFQWTEANCARSWNYVDGPVADNLLYRTDEPYLAKINLVGPLQASKFIIQ